MSHETKVCEGRDGNVVGDYRNEWFVNRNERGDMLV